MSAPPPRKIVFAPDLIGAALIDPAARRVLEAWRDGKIVAVTNRDLIRLHLRALQRIGLSPELMKRWSYWLTSPEKTLLLDKQFPPLLPTNLCEAIAKGSRAEIICWKRPHNGDALWILANELTA